VHAKVLKQSIFMREALRKACCGKKNEVRRRTKVLEGNENVLRGESIYETETLKIRQREKIIIHPTQVERMNGIDLNRI